MAESPPASANPDRIERIQDLLTRACQAKQFAGAAWSVTMRGAAVGGGVVGFTAADGGRPVDSGTLFDLASLTKPIATATAVLYLLDRAELSSADEVRRYIPQAGPAWDGITLRSLLTHTSGLPPYAALHTDRRGIDAIRDGILAQSMNAAPGERYDYSCLGYIMLQNIVQAIAGEGLDTFARRRVFEPLGMSSTGYCPSGEALSRAAAGGNCPHRGRFVQGEVHDPLAWAAGGVSGNAGLFSTVGDVARWASAIVAGGAGERTRLFSPAAARLMLTNQIDSTLGGQTYGLFAVPNGMLPRGELLPHSAVGHTGFTGTSVVIVPEWQLAAVLLCNSLAHSPDKTDFLRTRRLFHTLVGAALE